MDAVIPAGGTIPEDFAQRIGTPHRALAPVGPDGRPVMQIVVDALRDSGTVSRIIGVAAPVAQRITDVDVWLPAGDSGPANILRGLAEAEQNAPALVCASDLPLMTAGSVTQFVAACGTEAGIAVGLVKADALNAMFPDAPPSEFVPLRDAGPVTMGSLFQIRPDALARNRGLLENAFAARKSQWRMAGLLGPRLVWQFAAKSLTLTAIAARAQHVLGCRIEVVLDTPPELAYDMDTADDYAYAHAVLLRRPAATA